MNYRRWCLICPKNLRVKDNPMDDFRSRSNSLPSHAAALATAVPSIASPQEVIPKYFDAIVIKSQNSIIKRSMTQKAQRQIIGIDRRWGFPCADVLMMADIAQNKRKMLNDGPVCVCVCVNPPTPTLTKTR